MNRRFYFASAVTAVLIMGLTCLRAEQPNKVGKFMRAKLGHSQKILEGLSTNDLELVAKNAQDLSLLSLEAGWQVLQTEDYQQQSREFRRATDALRNPPKKRILTEQRWLMWTSP